LVKRIFIWIGEKLEGVRSGTPEEIIDSFDFGIIETIQRGASSPFTIFSKSTPVYTAFSFTIGYEDYTNYLT
jgi:hypothetical protein